MKKLYIICDYREKFPSIINGEKVYNDHISKQSMLNLISIINGLGYEAEYFGGVEKLIQYYHKKIDVPQGIYINLNDGLSEKHKRGQTPLLLEMLNVPYSGSDPFHTLLVNDKHFTNLCLISKGVMCPKSVLISCQNDLSQIQELTPPFITKPNYEGSSIGVSAANFCNNIDSAIAKTSEMMKCFDDILVQEYISGYEVTDLIIVQKDNNKVLFNQPLSISYGEQIFLNEEIFGIEEKYKNVRKYRLAEQVLDKCVIENIRKTSEYIVKALHLKNFVRIDYRIKDNNIYFIEANTNPAFGTSSDVGQCCKLMNISFEAFVKLFIESLHIE